MKDAAMNDQELNRSKRPAIAKLKLLASVMEHLSKYSTFFYKKYEHEIGPIGIINCLIIIFWKGSNYGT